MPIRASATARIPWRSGGRARGRDLVDQPAPPKQYFPHRPCSEGRNCRTPFPGWGHDGGRALVREGGGRRLLLSGGAAVAHGGGVVAEDGGGAVAAAAAAPGEARGRGGG